MRQLLATICLSLIAVTARGGQLTLEPSVTARITNPSNSGDVRVLYKFDLPQELSEVDIVLALLKVPTVGTTERLFTVGPLSQAWTQDESWSSLSSKFAENAAFQGNSLQCLVASNQLRQVESTVLDDGVEAIVTGLVAEWIVGPNYGVCVRGPSGMTADVSTTLSSSLDPPELVVLYTTR